MEINKGLVLADENAKAIGVYKIKGRKKPCLCVRKGDLIQIYGTFNNDEVAEEFMNEVAEFFGVTRKAEGEGNEKG